MEDDPLEDDRGQKNVEGAKKRYVPHQQKGPSSSPPKGEDQQQQQQPKRLVRPQTSQANPSNERKATTSTVGGVNMELKDPKERVLVRHATASSAYGVDDFKGKKKKIIKPWSSGRKKKQKQTK